MTTGLRKRFLPIFAIVCVVFTPAHAGIDVGLDREMQDLQELERLVQDIESAESEEELRPIIERWNRLKNQLRQRRRAPEMPHPATRQIQSLERELARLGSEIATIREEILRYFPKANNRVAVFTFDDSTEAELGDALSFIVSKHMLFSTRVRSFAVVNFQEGAAPSERGDVAYFEKVDKLTRDQDYSVAVWGRVTRARRGLRIDTFGQAYPNPEINRYAVDVQLPEAMGSESLSAGLVHDRFQLDTLLVDYDDANEFQDAAERIRELRGSPSIDAEVISRLPEDKRYYIAEAEGDWVRLQVRGGQTGWTSVRAFCNNTCARFLVAVDFANEVVAAGGGVKPRPPPEDLNDDTRFVYREIAALHALVEDPGKAAQLSNDFADLGFRGTGLANIHSVANVSAALRALPQADFATYRFEPEFFQARTQDFQQALTLSPSEKYAQKNLQALLQYSGDTKASQRVKFRSHRKSAIVVQISNYQQLADLANTGATRLAKALEHAGYEITLLVDATRAEILGALDSIDTSSATASRLLFFSGHTTSVGDGMYLMPADANPDRVSATGIGVGELAERFRTSLLLLDTAFPEALVADVSTRFGQLGLDALVHLSDAQRARNDSGLFPYFIGRGISGAADVDNDGFIDLKELELFVSDEAHRNGFQMNVQAIARAGRAAAIVSAPVHNELQR